MKNRILLIVFFTFYCLISEAQWTEVGGSATNPFDHGLKVSAICADDAGNIYAGTEAAQVYKWNGVSWSQLPLINTGTIYGIGIKSMITDKTGNLYVAGDASMDVARWDGTQWTILGNYTLHALRISSLAIDTSGNVYAAGYNTSSNCFVARWNGAYWNQLGLGGSPMGIPGTSHISVAGFKSDSVYAVLSDSDANGYSCLALWDGTNWSRISTTTVKSRSLVNPQVIINSKGTFFWSGTYLRDNMEDSSFILKGDGTSWQKLHIGHDPFITGFLGQMITDTSDNVYATAFALRIAPGGQTAFAFKWDGNTVSRVASNIDTCYSILHIATGWPGLVLSKNTLYTTSLGPTSGGKSYIARQQLACIVPQQKICMVTVDTNYGHNVVVWEKADKYATTNYNIYRDGVPVAIIDRDSLSEWVDFNSLPYYHSYQYRIATVDTCGTVGYMSPYHQSISFRSNSIYDSISHSYRWVGDFRWTPYEVENNTATVGICQIYIDPISSGQWQLLVTVPDTATFYHYTGYASYPQARYRLVIQLSTPCNPTRSLSFIYSNVLSHLINGSEEISDANQIHIYPNPVQDLLTININTSTILSQGGAIEVNDLLGKNFYRTPLNGKASLCNINMSDWPSGVYFVTISLNNNLISRKILKW